MESKALSDADLLNLLQSDLKTAVLNSSSENQPDEGDHEDQSVKTTNENGENMFETTDKDTSEDSNGIGEIELEKADMSDTVGIEKVDMSDIARRERADMSDTAGMEKADMSDTARREKADMSDTAGMEKADVSDTYGMEKADMSDTAGIEKADMSDTYGMEKADMSDTAGMDKADVSDTYGMEKADVSATAGMEKAGMSATAEDIISNESAMAHLSLNVNEEELDILNDSNTEDEEELNNETDKAEDNVASSMTEGKREPKSALHCAICSNYFDCPKLLECFHTFCEPCLMKRVKGSHKFLFCPICRYRSGIPKGGVANLIDNVVAASLIAAKSEEQQLSECMICKLHNEVKASAGQCIDCGDTMCEDCCKKHTFSRLTAKHKVVPLEEIKSEEYLKLHRKTKVIKCMQHSDETAEFFCSNCCVPVCRDCTMSGHRLHECKFLNDAIKGKTEHIQEKLESLKQECDLKLVDDTEESEILISEHEQNEFKKLKQAKDEMISVIEQKYYKCAEKLQLEYDIKRRKYCKHKASFIRTQRKDVGILAENVDFIIKGGSDIENSMLEPFIMSALEQKRVLLSKIRPKVTRHGNFPQLHVYREHLKVLEGLTFFTTSQVLRDQSRKDREEKVANSAMRVENAEVKMKIGRNFQTELNDVQVPVLDTQNQSMMSLMMSDVRTQMAANFQTGMNVVSQTGNDMQKPTVLSSSLSNLRAPVGRGRGFTFQASSEAKTRSSLLGEYTGQNRLALQDALSDNPPQANSRSRNRRHRPKKTEQIGTLRGQTFRLNLRTSLSVSVIMDQKLPDIVDIVFMSHQNFAVADAMNHRLKLFSLCGKFIKYIDDPGPMSVTFCANHLIWSSQFSSIKLYDVQYQKIVRIERVPQTASHPLTAFSGVKYLVGNMNQSNVQACTIDGSHVHVIQPKDRNGVLLPNITHIAARSSDQLVSVDGHLKKVVVNDFDGNFIGEYSHEGFEPGGACITEHDYIFVTDRKKNKLILLNAKAEYVRDWNTLINSPSCVASNGNGNIIVAGNGKSVSLYQYAYE